MRDRFEKAEGKAVFDKIEGMAKLLAFTPVCNASEVVIWHSPSPSGAAQVTILPT
jgi:hypothetical protein